LLHYILICIIFYEKSDVIHIFVVPL